MLFAETAVTAKSSPTPRVMKLQPLPVQCAAIAVAPAKLPTAQTLVESPLTAVTLVKKALEPKTTELQVEPSQCSTCGPPLPELVDAVPTAQMSVADTTAIELTVPDPGPAATRWNCELQPGVLTDAVELAARWPAPIARTVGPAQIATANARTKLTTCASRLLVSCRRWNAD